MECRDITIPSLLRQDFTSSSMTSPLIWSLLQTFVLPNRRDIIAGMCATLQECECWCCSCALCMRRARCDILYIPQLVAFWCSRESSSRFCFHRKYRCFGQFGRKSRATVFAVFLRHQHGVIMVRIGVL